MIFKPLKILGAYCIEPNFITDERGFFARCFCAKELAELGLCIEFTQCNCSYNVKKGTLRGMHFQKHPYEEVKLVRCTRGVIYDVILDLRPSSPTYKEWVGLELSADNHLTAYIPKGCAHGYQTLSDHCEVFYQVSQAYMPSHSMEVRFNDPAFNIEWPIKDSLIISDKDRLCGNFTE